MITGSSTPVLAACPCLYVRKCVVPGSGKWTRARGSGEQKPQVQTRSRASCRQPTRCSRRGAVLKLGARGKGEGYIHTRTAGLERTVSGMPRTSQRTKEVPYLPKCGGRVGYLSASTKIRETMLVVRAFGPGLRRRGVRTLGPRDSACTWHPATGALRPRVWPHFSTELPPGFPCSLFPVPTRPP